LGATSGIREVDEVASRFDDLLGRIDETIARERRFSAQASHELRTPLTVLRGELELSLRDPEVSNGAMSRALASAETMSRLVDALLLFGRSESKFRAKELELVNVCDLVNDEVGSRSRDDAARISSIVPEEALVLGEQHLLTHAIANLIDNACKHTPETATIAITVRLVPEGVTLLVADDGPGIAPGCEDRIFEPFFRDPHSRAQTEGHGLGLAFARSVARAHGGDVVLEANCRRGAVFSMRLPLATETRRDLP
jgi:signal transduction histidine kinase